MQTQTTMKRTTTGNKKILHVFTIISTACSFFDGQFQYLSEVEGYDIHLSTNSDCDEDFVKRNHLTYHQIPIARRMDVKADIKSIIALIKLIKREKFDAVVGHTPKGSLVAMLAARLSGIKCRIYYRHGLIYTTAKGANRFILKTVEKFTSFLANKIVNVSPSLSQLAAAEKLNSQRKQVVIGPGTCGGIDTINVFNPDRIDQQKLELLKKELGITSSHFIVGFCGRICKEKGIRELIDGFKMLRSTNQGRQVRLLLVGDYDTRDILPQEYKESIESDPDIINVGKVKKNDLSYYYALMDIITLPSYREGFGMCIIEAGAMGVPALVSRSHGCIDSIVENKTGQYITVSPDGIAEGLSKIMSDPEKQFFLGENASKYVIHNFERTKLWPQIQKFYNETLSRLL